MGLQIDLPTSGLLGINSASGGVITGNTTAVQNGIYVVQGSNSLTLTLPATMEQGGTVLLKNLGTGTVTIASALIEASNQSITVNNNQAVRLVYLNSTIGYLIT
jgi:hypothetical protein